MALAPGTQLGPYQIVSPLGAGGMGEVYRARDMRLDRDVVVKVLPEHRSSSPESRTRFEREAKTISQLNHPHICVLYDVGREGDTDCLVMELVEGETLATRLTRGALPAAEVLRLGIQISDALDRAHRAGVIHRDLKPGNLMLTKSGAKLMDFGLSRATGIAGSSSSGGVMMTSLTQSPTLATPLTAEGTIVGTYQYMAPEQLEGKEADARSGLWELGCVLYGMVTGRQAFEGPSQASVIAAILDREPPPIASLAPMTPLALEHAIQECLAKDPDERRQTAGDLRRELQWIAIGGTQSGASVAVPARRMSTRRVPWAVAGVLAAVAAISAFLALRPQHGPEPLAFRQLNFRREAVFQAAFAPDGRTVVYSTSAEGNTPEILTVRPEYPEPHSVESKASTSKPGAGRCSRRSRQPTTPDCCRSARFSSRTTSALTPAPPTTRCRACSCRTAADDAGSRHCYR